LSKAFAKRSYVTGGLQRVSRQIKDYKVVIVLAFLVLLIPGIRSPEFFSIENLVNVSRQASITGIVAVGMTFVILTGGIDLSVGAILAVTGVQFALWVNMGFPVLVCMLAAVATGCLYGLINGVGVTFFGVRPFIMTLSTMATGNGIALLVSQGAPIDFRTSSKMVDWFGNGKLAGIPGPAFLFVFAALLSFLALKLLPYGRYVYAVGGNYDAARLAGIKTTRILLSVYAISGICAAIAGIMVTCRLNVGHPTAGNFIMLDSIAAVVIGGTSLMGGRGTMAGTVAGALLLSMIANVLNLLGVSPYNQQVAKGLIIIFTVILTSPNLKQRIKEQWAGM
jgi:ribose transport system permease protein